MGTMIQSYNLKENDFRGSLFIDHKSDLNGCNDLLSITQPHIIKEIHNQYLGVGVDIVETNTFNSNYPGLADYGLEEYVYQKNADLQRGVLIMDSDVDNLISSWKGVRTSLPDYLPVAGPINNNGILIASS